jgi:protein ImuB
MARLSALMGEDRCGSPVEVDAWQPGAFAMKPFAPRDSNVVHGDKPQRHGDTEKKPNSLCASVPPWPVTVNAVSNHPVVALRRFRFAVPARVRVEDGHPVRVTTDRLGLSGGRVEQYAGPWRTSGGWWIEYVWDRDEWDVSVRDGATYRVFRERHSDAWFIEGIVD